MGFIQANSYKMLLFAIIVWGLTQIMKIYSLCFESLDCFLKPSNLFAIGLFAIYLIAGWNMLKLLKSDDETESEIRRLTKKKLELEIANLEKKEKKK